MTVVVLEKSIDSETIQTVVVACADASSLCLQISFSKRLRYDNVVNIFVILEDDNAVKDF